MKTELFRYVGSNDIKTFEQIQNDYMEENGSNLPIPYDEMHLIIMLRLVQNGGNIVIINDDLLKWCNKYSDYNEADRFLSQEEKNSSIRDIYCNIMSKDVRFVDEIKSCLADEDGAVLLEQLEKFLQNN